MSTQITVDLRMADTFSSEKRAQIMRSNKRSHNKSTELKLIAELKAYKLKGWRRNYKLPGSPDLVYPKGKLALFTDGCFWHGHDCRNTKPATNKAFWQEKIRRNKERDKRVTEEILAKGWKVLRIWECELRKDRIANVITEIARLLKRSNA